jgi:FtsZ-binding cell division protein ZapB
MVRRLVAQELALSFVPEPEQRLGRTLTRRKYQLRQDRVRFQNRLEALLEQMHIKLSGHLSDLLGVSGRGMLQGPANGANDPAAVASLAESSVRASQQQLRDALAACVDLSPVYRSLLKMELQYLQFLEQQMSELDQEIAKSARSARTFRRAARRSARSRSRFGAADHCRNGPHSSGVSPSAARGRNQKLRYS